MQQQRGFTLVEIAIVLVIIGLLLGGVLKGQELINSAKVKNFVNDFRTVPVFIYSYQDKFRALPGDDRQATAHLGGSAVSAGVALLDPAAQGGGTSGNGRIEGAFNSESASDESVALWQHIRLANLAAGSTNFAAPRDVLPTNADGGRLGVQSTPPITGMSGSFFVCSSGIQGKFARQIDVTMDDGATHTGSVRATAGTISAASLTQAAVSAAALQDDQTYTVCAAF
ncbi:prepilin-type N-terminal cleavage/methylation domain-containing protein [Oryzomicrobium sp.]|uniref:prepilin-type N-terminal cleavage/methylation domain-containing protein n=1 Tax=Oryzomicrobium sp. TaxID=1911578 RepID=UPI0025E95A94|nr:prepilin-type N-terminal cleavage/methylation domain-containing protein [Oryzomicrobium sp.]MCE1241654.1 prepilin-type N-terminal cleavage/methylation domain-containing protein [Oryzomicrobium sp.]